MQPLVIILSFNLACNSNHNKGFLIFLFAISIGQCFHTKQKHDYNIGVKEVENITDKNVQPSILIATDIVLFFDNYKVVVKRIRTWNFSNKVPPIVQDLCHP